LSSGDGKIPPWGEYWSFAYFESEALGLKGSERIGKSIKWGWEAVFGMEDVKFNQEKKNPFFILNIDLGICLVLI